MCRGRLGEPHASPASIACEACGAAYAIDEGYPVLLGPGDRVFEDVPDCCLNADEITTNSFTTLNYNLPLLSRLNGGSVCGLRLLSAGCGVGIDVDLYRDAGIEAVGVDCGARVESWSGRRHREAFHFASVLRLPYPDASFDAVVTGCLLPHIGVVGDSAELQPDAAAQREMAARELLRVTRPGGHIIMGNPNRLCPADLFHKSQMKGPGALARWHWPSESFLLSFADHEELFGGGARLSTLPVAGYWGFHSKERSFLTRQLARMLRLYFRMLSISALDPLRRSGLNPWLMVLATRRGDGGAQAAMSGAS